MRQFKLMGAALGVALLVAACGGGDGNQDPAVKYSAVVSFGDSLSDAGTYKAGPIVALGGGMFTVNGIVGAPGAEPVPSYNWAQLVSAAAIGKVSCAARNGGFGVTETAVAGCTNYAQGGSRVKDPIGVGNAGGITAALTESVTQQIANFAVDGNKITGSELITVLAGANDLFAQTEILSHNATLAGGQALATSLVTQLVALAPAAQMGAAQVAIGTAIQTEAAKSTATPNSIISAAITAAATHAAMNGYSTTAVADAATIGATAGAAAITAGNTYAATTGAQIAGAGMVQAATDLVVAVKGLIAQGAKRVLVVNIPDVSQTPMAMATPASQQALVLALTQAFNTALQTGLEGTSEVVFVDAFAENRRQLADPAHYALSNVKDVACNLDTTVNPLASSLVCNTKNLVAGDSSRYLFADGVHPTPYGHKLLAQYVTKALVTAGWL
jgi:outer membrane lipase/esterase